MLDIDVRNSIPIYKQIVEGMKEKIIKNELEVDEKLPSIRSLASQLRINPNTIKKAYSVLEQEGYLYSVNGRGSYVKGLEDKQINAQIEEINEGLKQVVAKAIINKIDKNQLNKMIDLLYKESDL